MATTLENSNPGREAAVEFLQGMRGQLIVSQALFIAIRVLEKVEPPAMRELSNIQDMKMLQENLFALYAEFGEEVVAMAEHLNEEADETPKKDEGGEDA